MQGSMGMVIAYCFWLGIEAAACLHWTILVATTTSIALVAAFELCALGLQCSVRTTTRTSRTPSIKPRLRTVVKGLGMKPFLCSARYGMLQVLGCMGTVFGSKEQSTGTLCPLGIKVLKCYSYPCRGISESRIKVLVFKARIR